MIGILGGTFDPIHFGHLRMAQELADSLKLSEVRFIPTGTPPHKTTPIASAKHRTAMVRLAIKDNPQFKLDERELNRESLSYTVDTLVSLRQELRNDIPICLLLGSDAFIGLPTWHRWGELLTLCHIVVAHRPQTKLLAETMSAALQILWGKSVTSQPENLASKPAGYIFAQRITSLDISATQIREDLAHQTTPRYLIPESVISYIRNNHLYTND